MRDGVCEILAALPCKDSNAIDFGVLAHPVPGGAANPRSSPSRIRPEECVGSCSIVVDSVTVCPFAVVCMGLATVTQAVQEPVMPKAQRGS